MTDWRSAAAAARFNSIDSYLAELNVAVDAIGGGRLSSNYIQ